MAPITGGKRVTGVARKDLVQKQIVNALGVTTTVYVRPDDASRPSSALVDSAMPSSSSALSDQSQNIIGRYETLSGIADDIRDDRLHGSVSEVLRESGGTDYEYLVSVRDKLDVLRETEIASEDDSGTMDDLSSEVEILLNGTPHTESITGGATSADCTWVPREGSEDIYLMSPNAEQDGAFALIRTNYDGSKAVRVQPGGSAHGHNLLISDLDGGEIMVEASWGNISKEDVIYPDEDSARAAAENYIDAISAMEVNSDEFVDTVSRGGNGQLISIIGRGAALNNVESENEMGVGTEFEHLYSTGRHDEAAALARECGFTALAERITNPRY